MRRHVHPKTKEQEANTLHLLERRRKKLLNRKKKEIIGHTTRVEISVPEHKQKGTKLIKYSELPQAIYSDGQCTKCEKYPNSTTTIETDEGMKKVIKCSRCATLMRPQP